MYSLKTILKESIPIFVLVVIISISAGLVLSFNIGLLSILPGILVIIPSFNQIVGGIASILSCRISSALHLGLIQPKLHRTKTLNRNITATYVTAIISFLLFGIIVSARQAYWFFRSLF